MEATTAVSARISVVGRLIAVTAFPQGSMDGSDPRARVGMAVHMPTRGGPDRGMPIGWVAPVLPRTRRGRSTARAADRKRKASNDIRMSACMPGNSRPAHMHVIV